MTESYAFPEGSLYVWTGSHTASGSPIAYVENVSVSFTWQHETYRVANGDYRNLLLAKRADVQVDQAYTNNSALWVIAEAGTACHIKVEHDNDPNGSAGRIVYSAVIDAMPIREASRGIVVVGLQAHGHYWTGY